MQTPWKILSGIVQGDITYAFRAFALSGSDADFILIGYSEKWPQFDIAFEFRTNKEEEWRKDANIILSNATKIDGNKIILFLLNIDLA